MSVDKWLELKDLSFSAGQKPIIKSITSEMSEKRCLAVMGASGSGKTTLMRILLGLLSPSTGSVSLLGEDVVNMGDDQRSKWYKRIGTVFQTAALISDLTVKENLMLPLYIQGKSNKVSAKDAYDFLAKFDLSDALNELPGSLSGGMKQRLGIARAMIASPELLILDEPLSSQDMKRSQQIEQWLQDFTADSSKRIIMVSHDPLVVKKLADWVWIIDNGELILSCDPEQALSSQDVRVQSLMMRGSNEMG